MDVGKNLLKLKNRLPENVKLVAVSKTKPVEIIMEAYNTGHRIFGENKVQDMTAKYEKLPKDIQWHFIGHLQTNKVRFIAPFVTLIHAVDSLKLLMNINKEAEKNNRIIPCLMQFHIATESTKFGMDLEEAKQLLESEEYRQMKNIRLAGVMGMATFTDDINQQKQEFGMLKNIFDVLKSNYFAGSPGFIEISMGMSDDWQVAIEQGSTMVRIGSSIFGAWN
ncbi:MAG: YggS family pyridoxal phosphate-dependent enzyme [Prolixibacteraceae bacterium]|nr:YggS family pyridoxal phosphate-dependent enzyme [Prolixibacteraceae bacterium]MBN2773766.1 YggS family pyridoxal phosphate-dependent enzyme [Prolixibacteraceae bacterium]